MVKAFMFQEANLTMTNKGFTLVNVLLAMAMIAFCFLLTLKKYHGVDNDYIYFMNDYLGCQSSALCERRNMELGKNDVRFYKTGRVNQARTINFNGQKVVVHLGNGYLTYE